VRPRGRILGSCLGLCDRLIRHKGGNVITTFALATPIIAILTLGAIDLASVSSDKGTLQDIADSAALMAAKQLGMADNTGLAERTKSVIAEQLAEIGNRLTYQTTVIPDTDAGTVSIQIVANRSSFFVNMLPPGGWNFTVNANAQQMGTTPLCVLSFGDAANETLALKGDSHILAPGCLVHGNSDIDVVGLSNISAGTVQAAGLATGNISPAPQTDAPAIPDPFSGMTLAPPGSACIPINIVVDLLPLILPPGIHCGNITVRRSASITLLPGDHYFQKGSLMLQNTASLKGSDVVMIFGPKARFQFLDNSIVTLKGRRQGNYAGFVIATTRDNTKTFDISSTAARELLGTVYIPNATLAVSGKAKVADQSAWTVIVAKSVTLSQNPSLVINKNYSGTNVPVPDGVGPVSAANVRLLN
jgi:Flp pilus assembly protein TadG